MLWSRMKSLPKDLTQTLSAWKWNYMYTYLGPKLRTFVFSSRSFFKYHIRRSKIYSRNLHHHNRIWTDRASHFCHFLDRYSQDLLYSLCKLSNLLILSPIFFFYYFFLHLDYFLKLCQTDFKFHLCIPNISPSFENKTKDACFCSK